MIELTATDLMEIAKETEGMVFVMKKPGDKESFEISVGQLISRSLLAGFSEGFEKGKCKRIRKPVEKILSRLEIIIKEK